MAPETEHHHGGADIVAPEKEPAPSTVDSSVERDAAKTSEEAEKQQPEQQQLEQSQAEERSMPPPTQQPQPSTEKSATVVQAEKRAKTSPLKQ